MKTRLRRFLAGREGATALEFAFTFPLLLLLSLGTLETMVLFYDFHKLGEATRLAARAFVIDPPVTDFHSLPVTCPAGCDADKLHAVVDSLQSFTPAVTYESLRVTISDSGLDVGGPGTLVTPIISVSLVGLKYDFFILNALVPGISASIDYPPFQTSRIAGTMP